MVALQVKMEICLNLPSSMSDCGRGQQLQVQRKSGGGGYGGCGGAIGGGCGGGVWGDGGAVALVMVAVVGVVTDP